MKISKNNPKHWLYLGLFGLWVTIAILARPFRSRTKPHRVILYGHTLSGNLLAIYRYIRNQQHDDITVVYLCLDPHEYRRVLAQGGYAILASRPACVWLLARGDAVITDHGLHSMQPMLFLSDLKFFDVWHGIPFKGFDANDFRTQHRYDEAWVASPLMARLYVDRFGFDADRVAPTGYPRTDRIVQQEEDVKAIKERLGLPIREEKKVILFAPTWRQDSASRTIFPFGACPDEFYGELSKLGKRTGATIVIRTHLNTPFDQCGAQDRPNICYLPTNDCPDTEQILLISDILVCDWSSIAFDFLLLERPTIFLDVPVPFSKGFSLGPEYRFGEIVLDLRSMVQTIEEYAHNPELFAQRHLKTLRKIRQDVYGGMDDGHATQRCVERLARAIAPH